MRLPTSFGKISSSMILFMLLYSVGEGGRLFNAPPNVKTGFQVLGVDWGQLLSEYQTRERNYGITLDFYSYFINCEMLQDQKFQLNDVQISAVANTPPEKGIHIHFECRESNIFNYLKVGNSSTIQNYTNFFKNLLQHTGTSRNLYFRPFQEFNNPWTGYPWVLEQTVQNGGCLCSWCSCNTGFYSNQGTDLPTNRRELNSVLLTLRKCAGDIFHFITAIDANQLNDDHSTFDRNADDIATVSANVANFYGLDGYEGQNNNQWRSTKVMFIDGPNEMESHQPVLSSYVKTIMEMGVAGDAPDRAASICAGLVGSHIGMVSYWDGPGSGGDYTLGKDFANTFCSSWSSK